MKTLTLTAALVAMTAGFAAPGFAMDNPVAESRAKIASALAAQKATPTLRVIPAVRATTFSAKQSVQLDRHQAAHQRLRRSQPTPSGR